MVERYFPAATQAALGEAARQAQEAAISMSAEGVPVRYLRSMFAPSDEWCFCLFSADSSTSVRQAYARLGIRIGAPMRSKARLPQPNDLYREPDEWLAPAHFRTRTKPYCLNDSGQIK